jgi:hypothetical protein
LYTLADFSETGIFAGFSQEKNKKKRKRRDEKEENNNKKRPKNYRNKKRKNELGRIFALVHNLTPKILPEGSAKLRWAGRGAGDLILHSLCGPVDRKKPLTWAAQVR